MKHVLSLVFFAWSATCFVFGQGMVSGAIYTRTGQPVGLAAVRIQYGAVSATTYTDSTGYYSHFVPVGNVPVTVTPDVNGVPGGVQNGLDASDVLALQNHILGIDPINYFELLIADFNNSFSLTTFDVSLLSKVISGEIAHFPDSTSWIFLPTELAIQDPWSFNVFDPLVWSTLPPDTRIGSVTLGSVNGFAQGVNFEAWKNGDIDNSAVTIYSINNGFISGKVVADLNNDCACDLGDAPLKNWLVRAQTPQGQTRMATTNSQGQYSISVIPGNYTVTAYPPALLWDICDPVVLDVMAGSQSTSNVHFAATPDLVCPLPEISAATSFLRRCFSNTYYVNYGNNGTGLLPNARITLVLDPYFSPTGASMPWSYSNGDTLVFDIGSLAPGQSGALQLFFTLDCNAPAGLTHCLDAFISPHEPCGTFQAWDGSSLQVEATCTGDEVVFEVTNAGEDMSQPVSYVIVEDVMLMTAQTGTFQLDSGASTTISVPANGSTWRMEVRQTPANPFGPVTGATIEACDPDSSVFSLGIINQFSLFDENTWLDTDCRQNIGSYDPNDKQGYPLGVTGEHFIAPGQPIEYQIRFQNTGTDTAFNVVVRDTISGNMDITTFTAGASGHHYDYRITGDRVVEFIFPGIMLPDSNVNEPASHGFIRFSIKPLASLSEGAVVENRAAIYFDFNEPVLTNTTVHTYRTPGTFSSVETPAGGLAVVEVWPQPASESVSVLIHGVDSAEGRLDLYDMQGRNIQSVSFYGAGCRVDTGALPAGIYLLKIADKQGRIKASRKITVE
ncbi:MAG: hypothetical protein RLZ62_1814 [Bacteroidota bacterium]